MNPKWDRGRRKAVYYAWSLIEGNAAVFHSGPRAQCVPEDLRRLGLPFTVVPGEGCALDLRGLSRHAEHVGKLAFCELHALGEVCSGRPELARTREVVDSILQRSGYAMVDGKAIERQRAREREDRLREVRGNEARRAQRERERRAEMDMRDDRQARDDRAQEERDAGAAQDRKAHDLSRLAMLGAAVTIAFRRRGAAHAVEILHRRLREHEIKLKESHTLEGAGHEAGEMAESLSESMEAAEFMEAAEAACDAPAAGLA
jgi:hypothetical protein